MATEQIDKIDARAQAERFLEIKKSLLNIQNVSPDACLDALVKNGYSSSERLDELLHLLLTAIDARPRCCDLYVALIQRLCAANGEFLETLKEFLLSTRERKVRRCLLIHRLYTVGIIKLDEILRFIDCMMHDKAFDFMKSHRKLSLGLFCWFAPEIEKETGKFDEYFEKIKDSHNSPYFRKLENLSVPFLKQVDELKSEIWKLHRESAKAASSMEVVAASIRRNEVFETSDWNACVEPTVFECCNFLNHYPSLLQYAAFHGSATSFKHILEHGGDVSYVDKKKRKLEEYAIAGGNPEIIDLVFAKKEAGDSPLSSPLLGSPLASPLSGSPLESDSPLSSPLMASPLAGGSEAAADEDEEVMVSGHRKVGSKRSLARDIGAERTFSGAVQRRHAKKSAPKPAGVTCTESHLTDQGDSYSNVTVAKFHRFGVIPPKAGTEEFLRCCKSNCLELLIYCVEHGVNPNTTDEKTKTPGVTIACQFGCLEVVRFLSTCQGVDLSIVDGTGVCFMFMEPHLFELLLMDGFQL